MSKIGKSPVTIPNGVDVTINWKEVKVKGTKGELSYTVLEWVNVVNEGWSVIVSVDSEEIKNLWGLTRTLIFNMVEWVTNGYTKSLMILWVGYWVKMQGSDISLQLWFSHPVVYKVPKGIVVSVDKDPKWNHLIKVEGIDKQQVWEVASKIRSLKKPEPYKGKGIRYIDEVIKLKPGKAAK